MLVGVFFLSGNRRVVESGTAAADNEYTITAVSLAQSVIDEAKSKAFDEKTVAGSIASRSDLTKPGGLGKDGGESISQPDVSGSGTFLSATKFDDVDDYNGYTRLVNTSRAGGFSIAVSVQFASETYPDSVKNAKTFCKKMNVTVTHPNMQQPVSVSYPFVY